MTTHVFMLYGQGGQVVDAVLSGDGIGYLQKLLDAIPGVVAHDPEPVVEQIGYGAYAWDAGAKIAAVANQLPAADKLVICGGSLGACEAPATAMLIKRDVDLIVGIQPSLYGRHNLVTSNVKRAVCIYNPLPFLTMGLGSYRWERTQQNKRTDMSYQYSYWPHPGDNNEGVRKRVTDEVRALAKS